MYSDIDNVELVGGDLFEVDTIPKAKNNGDAYYLRFVLHVLRDEECIKALQNVRQAMNGTKSTLFIGECALPDRGSVAAMEGVHRLDIQMMHLFDSSIRRPQQWKDLLTSAGFELIKIHSTRSMAYIIEAVPTTDA